MLDPPLHKESQQSSLDVKNNHRNETQNEILAELICAKDEWDAVQCIEPKILDDKGLNGSPPKKRLDSGYDLTQTQRLGGSPTKTSPSLGYPPNLKLTPPTDFEEVWEFFTLQDMSHVMPSIKPTMERKGVNGLIRSLFGPKKLKDELVPERNLLFAIAQCPLDNNEPLHIQILLTIYKVLTGTRLDCPRFGSHWDHIGFQGVDPATDLRGVGLLGLVQALYLVANEETFPLAREIYLLSHDSHSQFPLMVLSINVTRISLQALREGVLNKECNSRGNVRHVLNEYFAAVMFHVFWIWRTEHKTIKESGFLIKDAEAYCKANVRTVLQKLRSHLRRYSSLLDNGSVANAP